MAEGELSRLAEDQAHAEGEDGVQTGLGHDVERVVAVGESPVDDREDEQERRSAAPWPMVAQLQPRRRRPDSRPPRLGACRDLVFASTAIRPHPPGRWCPRAPEA